MRIDIRGVHVGVTEEMRDYFDKKIQKIDFAKDHIVDLLISLTKEKSCFRIESTVNFRWGNQAHLKTDCFDVFEAIDNFTDKLETKVKKEKEKIQHH